MWSCDLANEGHFRVFVILTASQIMYLDKQKAEFSIRLGKGRNQLLKEICEFGRRDKQSTIYPLLFIQLTACLEQSCCCRFEEFF